MSARVELRFAGTGGQGVVTLAAVLGDAAVGAGLFAAGSTSYGSAARGGLTSADVVIDAEPIDYPHVEQLDVLGAMSQEGYDSHVGAVCAGGTVLYDPRLVTPAARDDLLQVAVPATDTALDQLGRPQGANLVLLGALLARRPLVTRADAERAIGSATNPKFRTPNLKALALGFALGAGEPG